MPLFHNGDDLVLFVHIPKCGGTAIENSFRNAGWEWGYLNEPKKTGFDEKPCNPQHYHAELIEELIVPGGNTTHQIIVVRNPYTRLMSEFMWRTGANGHVKQHGYTDVFFKSLDEFTVAHLKAYKVNEAQYQLSKKQFKDGKQSFVFDNHFRPQHYFITDDWNIYWFEEMETKFWPEMKNKFGIESPGNPNTSIDLNIERPIVHPNPSNEFKELFTEIYYQDCKLFGYDLPF